eukprot:UN14073
MADWRNLPPRLNTLGTQTVNLDYTPNDEEEDFEDLEAVPFSTFWESNSHPVQVKVGRFKDILTQGLKGMIT